MQQTPAGLLHGKYTIGLWNGNIYVRSKINIILPFRGILERFSSCQNAVTCRLVADWGKNAPHFLCFNCANINKKD